MRRLLSIATGVAVLLASRSEVRAGNPYCAPAQCGILDRIAPVGGWHPDRGGALHWWNPCCFPRCGLPNDYCRKPTPCVCYGQDCVNSCR
jgi:hypothetical protein